MATMQKKTEKKGSKKKEMITVEVKNEIIEKYKQNFIEYVEYILSKENLWKSNEENVGGRKGKGKMEALQSSDLAASRTRHKQAFWRSKMGRKDASTVKLPVDQYRKQIGKQDYKKTKPILRATKLKAEAKKTAIGIKEVGLVLAAILALLLAFYAFFYLRLSTDVDPDLKPDED
ncbi:upf0599 protein c8orf83-like [Lynx pardinus]|uniref:Triple QxxK/R motif-containing protein n=1 Tax=Lynx pardinus TaxID=191816 RepID=A0A485MLB5_LYNPA|nr:upf0599 protein c8orf83-like [Lynx pardinus]